MRSDWNGNVNRRLCFRSGWSGRFRERGAAEEKALAAEELVCAEVGSCQEADQAEGDRPGRGEGEPEERHEAGRVSSTHTVV